MSRSLSLTARRAVNAQETAQAFLILLTIDHPSLPEPIRVTSDAVQTISRGHTYLAYPFAIDLPSDKDDQIDGVTLRIDNIDRAIVESLQQAASRAPAVTMEVVLGSSPDLVEAGPFAFELKGVAYDALVVSGTLGYEPILHEPIPGDNFDPARFPGVFK